MCSSDLRRGYVLVVDDDPGNRTILRRTIESCGFDVREAQEGREALSIIAGSTPDPILLDLNMPGMDGFEFMDELHRSPQDARIPVIVITAKDLSQESVAGLPAASRMSWNAALNRKKTCSKQSTSTFSGTLLLLNTVKPDVENRSGRR